MGAVIRDHERHTERKKEGRNGNDTCASQGTPRTAGFHRKASRAAWTVFPPQSLQREPTLPAPCFWRTVRE